MILESKKVHSNIVPTYAFRYKIVSQIFNLFLISYSNSIAIFHLKCSMFSGDLSVAEDDPVILHYPTPGGLTEDDVYELCSQVRSECFVYPTGSGRNMC